MTTEPAEILTTEPDVQSEQKPRIKQRRPGFWRPLFYTLLLMVGVVALALWYAIDQAQEVPDFYAAVLDVDPRHLEHGGDEFERNIALLNNAFRRTYPWKITFTQQQINGWIASDMPEKFPELVPTNISDPRIVFTENEAKLAFKYSRDGVNGIIVASADLFCTEKPNQIAVKLRRVKSGVVALPIGPWLEKITQRFQLAGVDIIWTDENGEPVALITIPEDVTKTGLHRHVIVEAIDLRPGRLIIAGSSVQHRPPVISKADQSKNSTQKR